MEDIAKYRDIVLLNEGDYGLVKNIKNLPALGSKVSELIPSVASKVSKYSPELKNTEKFMGNAEVAAQGAAKELPTVAGNAAKTVAQDASKTPVSNIGKAIAGTAAVGAGVASSTAPSTAPSDASSKKVTPPPAVAKTASKVQRKATSNVPKKPAGLSQVERMELEALYVDLEKAKDQPGVADALKQYAARFGN